MAAVQIVGAEIIREIARIQNLFPVAAARGIV